VYWVHDHQTDWCLLPFRPPPLPELAPAHPAAAAGCRPARRRDHRHRRPWSPCRRPPPPQPPRRVHGSGLYRHARGSGGGVCRTRAAPLSPAAVVARTRRRHPPWRMPAPLQPLPLTRGAWPAPPPTRRHPQFGSAPPPCCRRQWTAGALTSAPWLPPPPPPLGAPCLGPSPSAGRKFEVGAFATASLADAGLAGRPGIAAGQQRSRIGVAAPAVPTPQPPGAAPAEAARRHRAAGRTAAVNGRSERRHLRFGHPRRQRHRTRHGSAHRRHLDVHSPPPPLWPPADLPDSSASPPGRCPRPPPPGGADADASWAAAVVAATAGTPCSGLKCGGVGSSFRSWGPALPSGLSAAACCCRPFGPAAATTAAAAADCCCCCCCSEAAAGRWPPLFFRASSARTARCT